MKKIHGNKGKPRPDMIGNTLYKIGLESRVYKRGYNLSEETKAKMRKKHKKFSSETIEMLKRIRAGCPSPMQGRKHSDKTIAIFSTQRSGQGNPSWIDGRSFIPYAPEFNRVIKKFIRNRDGYVCKGCGMIESVHLDRYNTRLTIHHIDYDKRNNLKTNLITLCFGCNTRANKDRDVKIKHYKSIMEKSK